jgi:hypothetical protein
MTTQLVDFHSEHEHLLFELGVLLDESLYVVCDVVQGHENRHGADDFLEHDGQAREHWFIYKLGLVKVYLCCLFTKTYHRFTSCKKEDIVSSVTNKVCIIHTADYLF